MANTLDDVPESHRDLLRSPLTATDHDRRAWSTALHGGVVSRR